jgi:hypothetical protein
LMNGGGRVVAVGTISLLGKGPYPSGAMSSFPACRIEIVPALNYVVVCRDAERTMWSLSGDGFIPKRLSTNRDPCQEWWVPSALGLGPADSEPHHLAGLTGLRHNSPFIRQFLDDHQPPSPEVSGRRLPKYR